MFHPTLWLTALAALFFRVARADDSSTYPEWVTNDYNCVIGCLQGFNSSMTTIPNTDLENQSYQCISNNCDPAVASANKYQASYIIQLFYQTGSIYESSSEPSGSAWLATDYATSTMYSDSQATDTGTDSSGDDSSTDTDSSGGAAAAQPTTSAVSMGGITTASYSNSKSGSASVSASRASGTIANAEQTATSGGVPTWDLSPTLYHLVEMSMGIVCLVGSIGLFVL